MNITTWVTSSLDEPSRKAKPGICLRTSINLAGGKIENEIDEQFNNSSYKEIKEFHLQQVEAGNQIVDNHQRSLKKTIPSLSHTQPGKPTVKASGPVSFQIASQPQPLTVDAHEDTQGDLQLPSKETQLEVAPPIEAQPKPQTSDSETEDEGEEESYLLTLEDLEPDPETDSDEIEEESYLLTLEDDKPDPETDRDESSSDSSTAIATPEELSVDRLPENLIPTEADEEEEDGDNSIAINSWSSLPEEEARELDRFLDNIFPEDGYDLIETEFPTGATSADSSEPLPEEEAIELSRFLDNIPAKDRTTAKIFSSDYLEEWDDWTIEEPELENMLSKVEDERGEKEEQKTSSKGSQFTESESEEGWNKALQELELFPDTLESENQDRDNFDEDKNIW